MNASLQEQQSCENVESLGGEELTIKVASSYFQEGALSVEQKVIARQDAGTLYGVFEKALKENNEYDLDEITWNGEDELEMKYISSASLNAFMLEAEKLGKSISFEKVLKVKITD